MSAGNSVYSPLPQSNSDSDCSSEEELHIPQGNRIIKRAAKVQNSKCDKAYKEENNVVNYKPLDNEGDIEVTLNKLHLNTDEVSILKPDGSSDIFSTSRKICFVLSLFLCVFTTIAFLWILPCNVESCPNSSNLKKSNFTWEENLPNIEIYGPISVVPDHNGNKNLVFLTRNFLDSQNNHTKSRLKCLKGTDGTPNWEIIIDEEPTDVDCTLFDINKDGFNDCLIYGNNFLRVLRAIDSISGKKLWDIVEANKNEYRFHFEDFPLTIPDLDADGVNELLLPCSYDFFNEEKQGNITSQNKLIIISGKTGVIINNPLHMKLCSAVKNLVLENKFTLSYTCVLFNKKESFQNISLAKLFKTLNKKPNQWKKEPLKQHKRPSDTAYVNGYKLVLKNEGHCPEDCHVFVDVTDEHGSSNNKTIYRFNQKNMFGMTPVVVNNKDEYGFVIKFWKWHSKTENPKFWEDVPPSGTTITKRHNAKNLTKRSKKLNYLMENSKTLENTMLSECEHEIQRTKRTVNGSHKSRRNVFKNSLHVISEIITKISLTSSHLSLSNLTKDEIIQICKKPKICEPNVYHQKHSIFFAQLSADDTEKLITFNSKYIHEKEEKEKKSESWQLLSTIRVVNL